MVPMGATRKQIARLTGALTSAYAPPSAKGQEGDYAIIHASRRPPPGQLKLMNSGSPPTTRIDDEATRRAKHYSRDAFRAEDRE